jgi:outer membrane protein
MYKNLRLVVFASLFLLAFAASAQSAKYGHMNLGNFLESLEETKMANISLEKYAAEFQIKSDSMTKAFQLKANAFQAAYQRGELTQVQAQTRYQELQKEQQVVQGFEQQAEGAIEKRREELLTPILKKLDDAVKAVGKENGFTMIFDTSTGVTLFALETEDVTPLVKKKMGL